MLVALAVWLLALVIECLWLRFVAAGETFEWMDLLTSFVFLGPFALLLFAAATLFLCGVVALVPAGERLVDGDGLRGALVAGALIAVLPVTVLMFPVPVKVGDDFANMCVKYTTITPLVLAHDMAQTNVFDTDWSNAYWVSSRSC